MKTIEINLYKFQELSEEAKQNAIEKLSNINVSHEWWDSTYEDAKNVGIKLQYFELDRNKSATGEFIDSPQEVANKIIKEHGEQCETHKTALKFLSEIEKINSREVGNTEEEERQEADIEDVNEEFLKDILHDYANILQEECEYLQSEEAIIETIEANEYDFTEDGKLY